MLVHLPKPYDDELLHSVLARFLVYRGSTTIPELFDPRFHSRADLPIRLNDIAKSTYLTWAMSGIDIASQLTLFPFLTCYSSPSAKGECLKIMLSGERGSRIIRPGKRGDFGATFGIKQAQLGLSGWFRFCPICRQEDLAVLGETYWRRSHQLDGALVCTKHNQVLINSPCSRLLKACGRFWCDATQYTSSDYDQEPHPSFTSREVERLFLVAAKCQQMLKTSPTDWPTKDIREHYRKAAIDRGFGKGGTLISLTALSEAVLEFYGSNVLTAMQLGDASPSSRKSWFLKAFRRSNANDDDVEILQSFKHALIQVFLEHHEARGILGFSFGPWICPNLCTAHSSRYPVRAEQFRTDASKQLYVTAQCTSCGFKFTFRKTLHSQPRRPIVSRVISPGTGMLAEAKRMRSAGQSWSAIGRSIRIGRRTLKAWLENE